MLDNSDLQDLLSSLKSLLDTMYSLDMESKQYYDLVNDYENIYKILQNRNG